MSDPMVLMYDAHFVEYSDLYRQINTGMINSHIELAQRRFQILNVWIQSNLY